MERVRVDASGNVGVGTAAPGYKLDVVSGGQWAARFKKTDATNGGILVESAAGFYGAQMTAMRNASENAGELITTYTLQMNRARQAEITQEIMEVVAGAEGLS